MVAVVAERRWDEENNINGRKYYYLHLAWPGRNKLVSPTGLAAGSWCALGERSPKLPWLSRLLLGCSIIIMLVYCIGTLEFRVRYGQCRSGFWKDQ